MSSENIDNLIKRAVTQFKINKLDEAESICLKILDHTKENPVANEIMGLIYFKKKEFEKSEFFFKFAMKKSNNPSLYNNIGLVYKQKNNHSKALEMFETAITLNEKFLDPYFNISNIYFLKNELNEVKNFLEKNKILLEKDTRYFEALTNLHFSLNNFETAIEKATEGLKINSRNFNIIFLLGLIHNKINNYKIAENFLKQALNLNPKSNKCNEILGYINLNLSNYTLAKEYFKKSYDINNKTKNLLGLINFCNRKTACWDNYETEKKEIENNLNNNLIVISPFASNTLFDNPQIIYNISKTWVKCKYENYKVIDFNKINSNGGKIKIGYFSSDFYNHATSYLLKDVIKNHDKNTFEIHAFSFKKFEDDETTKSLIGTFDFFYDVSKFQDQEITKLCREKKIDIAVNLNGFTNNNRNSTFCHRNAEIQINYLGYPGSTCMKEIDYIIVDNYLINEKNKNYITEKKIFLPDCYQPNSSFDKYKIKTLNNNNFNKIPNEISIGCFCSPDKINPKIFNIWTNALNKFKYTRLYLIEHNKTFKENIKKHLLNVGLPHIFNKIIFLKKNLCHEKHLSNHQYIDLFLDTFPCNGHTTTSDAIYFRKPLITISGDTFPSRVAGSILKNVGLENLICKNLKDYKEKIFYYLNKPDLINQLSTNINIEKLYDMKKYTKYLEKGYLKALEFKKNNKTLEDIRL